MCDVLLLVALKVIAINSDYNNRRKWFHIFKFQNDEIISK